MKRGMTKRIVIPGLSRDPERHPRRVKPLGPGMKPGGQQRMSYGHFTSGGMEDRIEVTLPPVLRPKTVPRS
ncbi:hypothetical protein ACSSVQ_002992 [Parvibaculum sp. MBR-TMA-1.3b-4.2]